MFMQLRRQVDNVVCFAMIGIRPGKDYDLKSNHDGGFGFVIISKKQALIHQSETLKAQ